jgi:hypothetical protein
VVTLSLADDLFYTVAPWPLKRGARPPHAGRTQEWRNAQRTLGTVRHVDEPHSQGGCADEPSAFETVSSFAREVE